MPRLARSEQRTWEPHRDAALVDLTFGCGLRPEEARGERWWQVLWPTDDAAGVLRVREVIAAGQVAEGKTVGSYRDAPLPRLIAERLREWRDVASAHGLPTGPQDFVIPGLAPKIGKREPGGHMTANQEKKWGGKYLKPACAAVAAAYPERAYLTDATAYAGRRGHISSRLAAGKSPQPSPAIAARHARRSSATTRRIWVRTSTGPPFDEQLACAKAAVARMWVPRPPATETLHCDAGDHDWQRPRTPGTKPRSCPAHRSTRADVDLGERVPRGGAVAAVVRGGEAA
jgi:integrase